MKRAGENGGLMTFDEIGARLGISAAMACATYRSGMRKLRRNRILGALSVAEAARSAGRRHMSALVQTWEGLED